MPKTENLKQKAYDHIQMKLLAGARTGILVSDRAVAKEIGISRTPVREAISQLESDGLLAQVPGLGTVIKIPTRMELEELYDLRLMLETFAICRAAQYITEGQLGELDLLGEKTLTIGKKLTDNPAGFEGDLGIQWVLTDVEFHRAILRAGRCAYTARTLENLRILTNLAGPQHLGSSDTRIHRLAMTYREHSMMVRALQKHDPETAGALMTRHIHFAKQARLEDYDNRNGIVGQGNPDLNWPETVRRLIEQSEK